MSMPKGENFKCIIVGSIKRVFDKCQGRSAVLKILKPVEKCPRFNGCFETVFINSRFRGPRHPITAVDETALAYHAVANLPR